MKQLILLFLFALLQLGAKSPAFLEYESLSHCDVSKFAGQYDRSFDQNGVIMQKGDYHPLTVCMYGIMNYDAFVKTGDSAYYRKVVNQYNFFKDTTHFVYQDNKKSVGLSYNYGMHDINAPWISGMTQGTAASFLIRYYKLTNDQSALKLCSGLIHLLLKKEEEGGAIGRTKEGRPWIEEYPGSKKAKSVMNGFVNGFLGLYEYCEMFPDDKYAAVMRDSCYDSMIESVTHYDTHNWTLYSRGGWRISNAYMRYQLQEFDHLYTLFGDERIRNQMRIWSKFNVNRLDTETLFLKNPRYQFAMEIPGDPANDTLIYNDYKTFLSGLVEEFPVRINRNTLGYHFNDDRYYCELSFREGENTARKIRVSASYRGNKVNVACTYSKDGIRIQSSQPFDDLDVKFPNRKSMRRCSVSLKSYDYKSSDLPLFGFCVLKKIEFLKKGVTYSFNYEGVNLTNATVLYRYAPPKSILQVKKFKNDQAFKLLNGSFVAPEDGSYQFFISYDLTHPYSSFSNVKLLALN